MATRLRVLEPKVGVVLFQLPHSPKMPVGSIPSWHCCPGAIVTREGQIKQDERHLIMLDCLGRSHDRSIEDVFSATSPTTSSASLIRPRGRGRLARKGCWG